MTYATEAALNLRFGSAEITGLADRNNDSSADAGVIDAALADADAEIDMWLLKAGIVLADFDTVPDVIVRHACNLARYYLHSHRKAPEEVRQRYEDTMAWLKDVANGVIGFDDALDDDGVTARTGITSDAPTEVYTDTALTYF